MNALGQHAGLSELAMSKHEVCARLCQAGVDLDLHAVPEFNVFGTDRNYAIDVIWALRGATAESPLWIPVAAFEVEGVGVTTSLVKDAASLSVMARLGAPVLATVLFQVGPNGEPWGKTVTKMNSTKRAALNSASARVTNELAGIGASSVGIDVLLDEDLPGFLAKWTPIAKQRRDDLLKEPATARACR
ncbi:MAG: hypothetical protein IPG45_25880 [Deltaproteobacteria bacterium]|nr:hypothetical protein [Deltaproteobacteria bacterium]